jgi:EmrB/QacA subfamily drug resistance transporter
MSAVLTERIAWQEPRARWVVGATVLGSALTFIDATVVNIALPHIGADLGVGSAGLTWVVNAYSLTLAALVLLGGSLGDRLGRRRVFVVGVLIFAAASALCGLAPNLATLIIARAAQGVGGALLTPASLAILQATFAADDRARAISAWSGLTGVAGAVGPLLGGWLVQVADWRWVFWVNLPVAAVVIAVTVRHVPETKDPPACPELDGSGAALLAGALGAITYGLTALAAPLPGSPWLAVGIGLVLGVAFVIREQHARVPLLPLGVFRSRLFVAANVVTLVVYAAIAALFFGLGVTLQVGAGFSPLAAGLALTPMTLVMLLFSARVGAFMTRTGPRPLMTAGLAIAAVGVAAFTRIDANTDYVTDVLIPAAVMGVGVTLFVGPLTATVLAAVPDSQAGLASGVNNAVARTAGLLAVAALPAVVGLGGSGLLDPDRVLSGFSMLAWICAGLMALGAVISWLFVSARQRHCANEPAPRYCSVNTPPVPEPVHEPAAA